MRTKFLLFTLLSIFCFQTISGQNVGWFYGSTDGSDAIDLKLGYRNSGSSNNFTLSSSYVSGSAYLDYRSSAWSNQTTWKRSSSTGTKNILRFGGADGIGHYLTIFDKDSGATSMVKLNASGDSFFRNDLGIGTTSPASTLHINGTGGSASGYSISNNSESVRGYFRDNTVDADYVITYLGSGEAEIELQADGDVILGQAGKVGIGTTDPEAGFHFELATGQTNSVSDGIAFMRTVGDDYSIQVTSNGGIPHIDFANQSNEDYDIRLGVYNEEKLAIMGGDVGIGTTNPSRLLHVNGSTTDVVSAFQSTDSGTQIVLTDNSGSLRLGTLSNGGFALSVGGDASSTTGANVAEAMRVTSAGNVGIGTAIPSNKLEVNGTARAKEVIVEATGWPDFVFYPDYNLPSLEEVEDYITENKHLPEVPSESEILEQGIRLGEMDATLLQKIEELTLYMIEQNKINKQQQELIEELQAELKTLKKE